MSEHTYRPLGGLNVAAKALLYAQAALSIAAAAAGYLYGHDFDGSGDSPVYSGLAALQLLIFVAGGLVFFVWLYRTVANVHALGARGFSSGPAMAIVWYFIPLANLVMPYITMRDSWRASVNPRDWEAAPSSPLIGLWWAFWLIGNITGLIVFRLATEPSFESGEAVMAQLSTVSDAFTAVASVLLAAIIGRIARMQAEIAPAPGSAAAPNPARISSN